MDLNRIMEYKYFTNRIAKIEIIDHQKFITSYIITNNTIIYNIKSQC